MNNSGLVNNLSHVINPANQVVEKRYNNVYWLEAEIQYKQLFEDDLTWNAITLSADPVSPTDDSIALTSRYQYNVVGLKQVATTPGGKSTTFYYDELQRLRSVEDAAGTTINYGYDERGNKIFEEDGTGKVTEYKYNSQNKLQQVIEAGGAVTNYLYDVEGNLVVKKMADGHTTIYKYNQFGQMIAEERATDPWISYLYDSSGKMISMQDRKGQETKVFYNRMGMPIREEFYRADGTLEDKNLYVYDKAGHRVEAINGKSEIMMVYNALGQVISETRTILAEEPRAYTIGYEYDMAGNMTKINYPDGEEIADTLPLTVEYSYDTYNRLVGVKDFVK